MMLYFITGWLLSAAVNVFIVYMYGDIIVKEYEEDDE